MGTSTIINTEAMGKLSWSKYNKLVKASGTQVRAAQEMGVAPSTVRNWGMKLRKLRSETSVG